ncbi:MAG TPA: hypothetical protein VKB34_15795 [Povalibacter sp.]|nr:hypothetical protein [Povalibacter sp.]
MIQTGAAARLIAAVCIVGIAACSGCSRELWHLHKERTELPGFSLWLPGGKVQRTSSNPSAGTYELKVGDGLAELLPESLSKHLFQDAGTVKIHWRGGALSEAGLEEQRQLLQQGLMGIAQKPLESIQLSPTRSVDVFEIQRARVAFGVIYCEPGLTITVIAGFRSALVNTRDMASEIAQSLQCKVGPDVPPVIEARLSLPDHYGRALDTAIPTYLSPRGPGVFTNLSTGDLHRDTKVLSRVLSNLIGAALKLDKAPEASVRMIQRPDKAPATLSVFPHVVPDSADNFYIGTLYSADSDLTFLFLTQAADEFEHAAVELTFGMSCPDGKPIVERSVSQVFGDACDDGNARACVDLAELVAAGSADTERGTREDLRSRACKLGVRSYCVADAD